MCLSLAVSLSLSPCLFILLSALYGSITSRTYSIADLVDCPADANLARAVATTKTWQNGTGATETQIEIKKTFTSGSTAAIRESGLFNSTAIGDGGMLSHRTFAAVSLTSGDSITVTWTFKVGN